MTQKLVSLKGKFLIISMVNILLLQLKEILLHSAARLTQANLVTKTSFDAKFSSLNGNITSNKTKDLLLENGFKNQKHLIQYIFRVKVLLKMILPKIIQFFKRCTNILILLLPPAFSHYENLRDCLMKLLSILHPALFLLQN